MWEPQRCACAGIARVLYGEGVARGAQACAHVGLDGALEGLEEDEGVGGGRAPDQPVVKRGDMGMQGAVLLPCGSPSAAHVLELHAFYMVRGWRGGRKRARMWASTVRLRVWRRTRVSVEGAPPTSQSSKGATWACREPCSCLVGAPALRMCWNCTHPIW